MAYCQSNFNHIVTFYTLCTKTSHKRSTQQDVSKVFQLDLQQCSPDSFNHHLNVSAVPTTNNVNLRAIFCKRRSRETNSVTRETKTTSSRPWDFYEIAVAILGSCQPLHLRNASWHKLWSLLRNNFPVSVGHIFCSRNCLFVFCLLLRIDAALPASWCWK